ncbi:MAG TPA: hypothetical protein VE569_08640 [Acidimicrobiia bacterium]|jgi:hypothetical protein|nr:hypothetical protein [Acidimicrobiia bacterium]
MRDEPNLFVLPEPDTVVVVYDRNTGRIHHVHQEVNLPGAAKTDPSRCLETALKLAGEMTGKPIAALDALAVEPPDRGILLQAGQRPKVDVKKRRLVAVRARRNTTQPPDSSRAAATRDSG